MAVELTRDEIQDFLATHYIGHLGMVEGERPYVVPIAYAFSNGAIYCHSAQGMKVQAMRARPDVCFEVDDVESIDRWRSVIAWGTFEQLVGADAISGREILVDRLRPLAVARESDPPPVAGAGLLRALDIPRLEEARAGIARPSSAGVVFRIELSGASGRLECPE